MGLIVKPGRPWAIQELREKSWEDLHKLWWACVKERNRIATSNMERQRLKAGFGDHEANERDRVVSWFFCWFWHNPFTLLSAILGSSATFIGFTIISGCHLPSEALWGHETFIQHALTIHPHC